MMTEKTPLSQAAMPVQHDPYRMRSLEQILSLLNQGEFLKELMKEHTDLQTQLLEHLDTFGAKGCTGSMTITVNYELQSSGDIAMTGTSNFKGPKRPASRGGGYLDADGNITLMSPMLTRMHQPIRDADDHPADVRDID